MKKQIIWKELLFLSPYLKPYKIKTFIYLIIIIGLSILALPLPALNGACMDMLTAQNQYPKFFFFIFLILFINISKFMISKSIKKNVGRLGNHIVKDLKMDLILKSFYLPMDYIDSINGGYLFSRINECENIRRLFSTNLVTLLLGILDLMLSFIAIIFISTKMTMITLSFIPLLYFLIKYNSEKLTQATTVVAEQNAKVTSTIVNILNSIKFIKILNLYHFQTQNTNRELEQLLNTQNEQIKWNTNYTESIQLISSLHNLLILAVAGYFIFTGKMSIGLYITYIGYSGKLFGNVLSFSSFSVLINPVIVSIKRIKEFYHIDQEKNGPDKCERSVEKIRIDHISFHYGSSKNKYILNNLTFTISKNKPVLLIGNNGSGKTTLLSLLLGLYDVQKGNITIGNININSLNKEDLRNQISYMSQDTGIFEGSLEENLLIGSKDSINIIQKLKELRLENMFEKLGLNLNHPITHNGTNLSGGQKQIITFLRVALQNRQIVILDEPTNSLDVSSKYDLIQFIKEHCIAKKILIIVTHDEKLAADFECFETQTIKLTESSENTSYP